MGADQLGAALERSASKGGYGILARRLVLGIIRRHGGYFGSRPRPVNDGVVRKIEGVCIVSSASGQISTRVVDKHVDRAIRESPDP